ncbi:hypothetical protein HanRHA438_Chr04g0199971 [Helianthus annuus]|nr:hypothetical protein HanRHA438_Chr04g0199971 [Helianthus annuus]
MYIKLKLIISKIIRAKPSRATKRAEPSQLGSLRAEPSEAHFLTEPSRLGSLLNRAKSSELFPS